MSYRPPPEDKDPGSVKSLLSILRAQQDAPQPPSQPSRAAQRQTTAPRYPWLPQPRQDEVDVPSNQDLQSLLAALNPTTSGAPSKPTIQHFAAAASPVSHHERATPPTPSQPTTASFAVSQPTTALSAPSQPKTASFTTSQPTTAPIAISPSTAKPKSDKLQSSVGHRTLPLNKALPLVASLLVDDTVLLEVKKLKSQQEALEKTLWKKRQDILVQHAKRLEGSLHTARILGAKTISAQEEKVQKAWLDRTLSTFYTKECLPAFDARQREQLLALQELGIPGLGEDDGDEKTVAKRRRIMDFIDGMVSDN